MLVPNVFQVVFLHRAILPVQKGTRFTHEDSIVQNTVGGLIFHAVDTKLVEFVIQNFLIEVGNQIWMLNLCQVFWHSWNIVSASITVRVYLCSNRLVL